MSITVYYGSNMEVAHPDSNVGRLSLDFGQGFYVTDIKDQAWGWARQVAGKRGGRPVVNTYTLLRDDLFKEATTKVFERYDKEWLDFVVKNRQQMATEAYDYVEGGVADDRVIDSVRLYMMGLLPMDITLQRLTIHKPNNQICLRNQRVINNYLIYDGADK